MQLRRLRTDEEAISRYVEECWEPFHEELSATVEEHSLEDDLDREDVVSWLSDELGSPSARLWVALEAAEDLTPLSRTDGTFAGFVRTELRTAPEGFDWENTLIIKDIWVAESYRGRGLADDLLERAVQQAREDGCEKFIVGCSVENERAIAYFEKAGFEAQDYRMKVPLADVTLETTERLAEDPELDIRRVRIEESALRRLIDECWEPFHEDLGAAIDEQYIDPEFDKDALLETFLEELDVPDRRSWVPLDGAEDPTASLPETDGVFAGWLNAGLEPTREFLDPPERLFIGNLYAKEAYRGTGLADQLVARAIQYAREEGCGELSLGVAGDNDRAMAYYEKLGFEPFRQSMTVPLEEIDL